MLLSNEGFLLHYSSQTQTLRSNLFLFLNACSLQPSLNISASRVCTLPTVLSLLQSQTSAFYYWAYYAYWPWIKYRMHPFILTSKQGEQPLLWVPAVFGYVLITLFQSSFDIVETNLLSSFKTQPVLLWSQCSSPGSGLPLYMLTR